MKKQPFQKGKEIYTKITAGVAALAVTVTGGVAAFKLSNNNSGDYVPPSNEISTDVEEEVNLYLSKGFSISDPEEVKERATKISEILEDSMPLDKIMDMIYLINGSNKGITFDNGATDTERFNYLQNLIVELTNLLNDNIRDDVNAFANSKAGEEVKVNDDQEIYSYMFISKENKEAKKIAIELAMIINEQLDNIKNSNVDDYEEITKRFYSLYEDVQGSDYDESLKLAIITDIQQHAGLFNLTDEMSDKIYKNQAVYSNDTGYEAVEDLDIDMDKVINDAEENGFGNTVTPNGSGYNSEDAEDAMNYVDSGSKEETTEIVNKGGEERGTTQTVISGGGNSDTEEKTEIFVEDIPDEIIEGNGEVVAPGGDPVIYTDENITVPIYSLK